MAKKKETEKEVEPQLKPDLETGLWGLPDGHYCINGCGFDIQGTKIELAPTWKNFWGNIETENEGLEDFIKAQNKYLAERFKAIAARRKHFWEAIQEDLGIDLAANFPLIYERNGYLRLGKRESDDKAPSQK